MKLPIEFVNTQEWTLVGPMGPRLTDFLAKNPILCVDGGADFTAKMDIWVGDGDSAINVFDSPNIFKFAPQKSESDLALALSLVSQASPRTLHLWGFVGGRKDHELLNLGEVMHYLENKTHTEVIFYDGDQRPVYRAIASGDWAFPHTGTFSVASIKPVKLKILGHVSYPLPTFTELAPLCSLGLSNSAEGEIQIINDGPVLVIFPELK
jgi:thiamine pyrophosphokinase